MIDPEKMRLFMQALKPDLPGLARQVFIENPQTALRELPGKLQASRDLLNQYEPGKGIDPRLMDQFMNLTGFAPAGIFIGAKSKLWNKDAAKEFLNLEKKGVAPQEAWQKTGTFRSPDGKLRQEISDDKSVARFDLTTQETQKELDLFSKLEYGKSWKELEKDQRNDIFTKFEQVRSNLQSKLSHEDLYRAYPDLASMRSGASYSDIPHGEYMLSEMFEGSSKIPQKVYESIFVGGPDVGTVRSSLLHEAQHAIQSREGFERGGSMQAAEELLQKNPSLAHKPMAAYRRFAGEAEARAVQNRMDMTPEQRLARFPLESYDVGIKELIMRSLLD